MPERGVNVGSGDFYAAGWCNVDMWHGTSPDVVGELGRLPFAAGSVERVYCGHVLEHVEPDQVVVALEDVRRVLAPGGELCVVGPDYDRAVKDSDDDVLLGVIRDGGDRWPGDRHLWLSTEATTLAYVAAVFADAAPTPIIEVGEPWPLVSDVWWQFAITATKPFQEAC